jgi:uncharacterized protein YceH (UPF0502 family)
MTALQLEPLEGRVLGVLIEKELTTPEQYPLSLHALVAGCNQKNNRDPLLSVGEAAVNDAILKLRVAGLVDFVQLTGQRVEKYKHKAGAALHLLPAEVAVLAELLLRGAQQPGELRGRVERMHPMPDLPALQAVLDGMAGKGLVVRHERVPGERANRYAQTLCPAQAAAPPAAAEPSRPAAVSASRAPAPPSGGLEARVAALEAEVAALRERLSALGGAVGSA